MPAQNAGIHAFLCLTFDDEIRAPGPLKPRSALRGFLQEDMTVLFWIRNTLKSGPLLSSFVRFLEDFCLAWLVLSENSKRGIMRAIETVQAQPR